MNGQWNHKIFSVNNAGFEALALEIFRLQQANNPVYKAYVNALRVDPVTVTSLEKIPFLPIRFFKTHSVVSSGERPQARFESSGTTGEKTSSHDVTDLSLYEESFLRTFELFYGSVQQWRVIGLLPSYLERTNSSLVYMVNKLIRLSSHPESGFYLDEYDVLMKVLKSLDYKAERTLLIGVTFALLDFGEQFREPLSNTVVMETGGMKGRRKEMIREEVHAELKKFFSVSSIHSEYGMTELLSQAYSRGNGLFKCPPWMQILIREEDDPLQIKNLLWQSNLSPLSGAMNIIDLANINSCSFIATDDLGKLYEDGSFEVQGRMDVSDIRGCNLLIA